MPADQSSHFVTESANIFFLAVGLAGAKGGFVSSGGRKGLKLAVAKAFFGLGATAARRRRWASALVGIS